MILAGELRKGSKILYNNEPYIVTDYQHVKPGKGGAFMRTKMRNLLTGLMHEVTFRSEEKLPSPDLQYRDMLYSYEDNGNYEFFDKESYEQVALNKKQIGDVIDYLKEQTTYTVLFFNDEAVAITAPISMELEVVDTPPGEKGNTAQGGSKPATLETGLVLQVPLFVNIGDIIKVDTREAKYVERVKK